MLLWALDCWDFSKNHALPITAQDVTNVGEVRLRSWRRESRKSIAVSICWRRLRRRCCSYLTRSESLQKGVDLRTVGSMGVLRAEVSLKGGATSGTAERPWKEERSQEWLDVFGRRSGIRNGWMSSEGGAVSGRRSAFLDFGKILELSSWAHNRPAITLSLLLVQDASDEIEHVSQFWWR